MVTEKKSGSPKSSRNMPSIAAANASGAASTSGTAFAQSSRTFAPHFGCKQPPGRPRQTPGRKCKLKISDQKAGSAPAPKQAQVTAHVRRNRTQHKRQRVEQDKLSSSMQRPHKRITSACGRGNCRDGENANDSGISNVDPGARGLDPDSYDNNADEGGIDFGETYSSDSS